MCCQISDVAETTQPGDGKVPSGSVDVVIREALSRCLSSTTGSTLIANEAAAQRGVAPECHMTIIHEKPPS